MKSLKTKKSTSTAKSIVEPKEEDQEETRGDITESFLALPESESVENQVLSEGQRSQLPPIQHKGPNLKALLSNLNEQHKVSVVKSPKRPSRNVS